MKKRKFLSLCATSLLASLAGQSQEQTQSPIGAHPSKILIAYYSWGGNTRFVAEEIQQATGGTIFEIETSTPYPTIYRECTKKAKEDIQAGFKPELARKLDDIRKYDVIFIGSPNWWSTIAPPVASFISQYDLSGKTIIPFVTHGGGGLAGCERDIRKICPSANVKDSGVFSGDEIRNYKEDIARWVSQSIRIQR